MNSRILSALRNPAFSEWFKKETVLEVKHSLVFSEHERVVCREEHQAVEWILWRQASPMSTAGFECSLFAAELVDGLEDD